MVKIIPVNGSAGLSDTTKLESISWQKPGMIEITLSQLEDPEKPADAPNLSLFTDLHAILVGSKVEFSEGVRRRFFTYRRGQNIMRSPTDRQSGNHQEEWSVNTTLSERQIQRHPKFLTLKKKYNGSVVNEVVIWPRHIQDPASTEKKIIKNPFFGVRMFLTPSITVTVQRGTGGGNSMDFSQLNEVGYIDAPTDFSFFAVPVNDRTHGAWILTERSFRSAGGERLEQWAWQSSVDGFPKAIYQNIIQGATNGS